MSGVDPGRDEMKWWGWGAEGKRTALDADARALLRGELGEAEPTTPVALTDVSLPEAVGLPSAVRSVVGGDRIATDHELRVRRAGGKSYPDLHRARTGALEDAPDAVVRPADGDQVAATLAACSEHGVAVVPFGGGTSVVGGLDALRGAHDFVIALDLGDLRGCEVDERSQTASLGPGLRGPEAEAALGSSGYTLGHFPQSFEYATIGGFAATRSAGQASAGYGRFDELVSAIELTTPIGVMRTLETPHSAAGPALRELAMGSEGTLGVVTDVTTRIRPIPEARRYEGWIAEGWESGREAIRALAQAGNLPDVTRLSDHAETRISMAMSNLAGVRRSLFNGYLRMRGREEGCVIITGWEGEPESVQRRRALSARTLRAHGAVALGRAPGQSWERGRFDGPYLRDELMDLGYFVETLETSHTWARLNELYGAVGSAIDGALEAQGTPGLVMCHLSHAYRDGASLYFTFISRSRPGSELKHWRAVKGAACDAIAGAGGTITHHHAVGRDHAPWMEAEVGPVGLEALRACKERLDPAGIMNPGKLLT